MPDYIVELTDEVTYSRRVMVSVTAKTKKAATEKVLEHADTIMSECPYVEEDQTANAPYDAEITSPEAGWIPWPCPTKASETA